MTFYDLNMNSKRINNTQDPSANQDVATKNYVDTRNKVVQIVTNFVNSQVSNSTNVRADTGLTATITPTSASNKILVHIHQQDVSKDTNDTYCVLELFRGATNLFEFSRFAGYSQSNATANSGTISGIFEDSPNTTSPVTYKTTFLSATNNARVYVQTNNGRSTIMLMEVTP